MKTHCCQWYLHRSHAGTSYCDLDVSLVGYSVFFLWQKVLWKIKEADVEDQWRGGSTGKPRAHLREHACQFRLSTVWLEGSPAGYNSRTDLHFTHTQTHWEAQRNTHTHTIASVSATFLCGVEKALKQHLDQQRTLKIPSETQKFVQVCQLFRAERAISPI